MKIYEIKPNNSANLIPGNGEWLTEHKTEESAINWLNPLACRAYENQKNHGKGVIYLSGGKGMYVPTLELSSYIVNYTAIRHWARKTTAKEFIIVNVFDGSTIAAYIVEMDDTLENIWKSLHIVESAGGARFKTEGVV